MTAPEPGACVVLLAAGRSERFGGDKLTADLRGRPLWEWAARAAEEAGFSNRFVVVGPDYRLAERQGWTPVVNRRAHEGMGTSIAAGVLAASGCQRVVIMLADMPFVEPAHLLRLAQGETAMFTRYDDGRHGCPAAFPRSAFAALATLEGDQGARRLTSLSRDAGSLRPGHQAMLVDLDTREDFARLDTRHPPA